MPEVRLGIPSVVEAALLPMLVGWGRTRWMLMLGETFDAHQAHSWGLVETVVAPEALDEAVNQWVESLFKCSSQAVMLQKQLIRSWEDLPLRTAITAGIDTFGAAYSTSEPGDAMRRFLSENAQRKKEARSRSEGAVEVKDTGSVR